MNKSSVRMVEPSDHAQARIFRSVMSTIHGGQDYWLSPDDYYRNWRTLIESDTEFRKDWDPIYRWCKRAWEKTGTTPTIEDWTRDVELGNVPKFPYREEWSMLYGMTPPIPPERFSEEIDSYKKAWVKDMSQMLGTKWWKTIQEGRFEEASELMINGLLKMQGIDKGWIRSDDQSRPDKLVEEITSEKGPFLFTGFDEADSCWRGFRRGELDLICGFTHSGKSKLVTWLSWKALQEGMNGLIWSTEARSDEVDEAYVIQACNDPTGPFKEHTLCGSVRISDIDSEESLPNFTVDFMREARTWISKQPGSYSIAPSMGLHISNIRANIKLERRRLESIGKKLNYVIIDHPLHISDDEEKYTNDLLRINSVMRKLKTTAMMEDILVLCAFQISRKAHTDKKNTGRQFDLTSLSWSHEAGQSADKACVIHDTNPDSDGVIRNLECIWLKGRRGKRFRPFGIEMDADRNVFRSSNVEIAKDFEIDNLLG